MRRIRQEKATRRPARVRAAAGSRSRAKTSPYSTSKQVEDPECIKSQDGTARHPGSLRDEWTIKRRVYLAVAWAGAAIGLVDGGRLVVSGTSPSYPGCQTLAESCYLYCCN